MVEPRITFCARYCCVFVALWGLAASAPACRPAPATPAVTVSADTWAVVDGRQITRDDVDKAYRRRRDGSQKLSKEETRTAKLGLLDDLILQDILLAKARALNLDVAQADLDTAFSDAKKNLPDGAFQQ